MNLKMKRMSSIVYNLLECSLRTIHVTVLLISVKYRLFISIQYLAKPEVEEDKNNVEKSILLGYDATSLSK
jgi:hypothetical protein